MDVSWDAGGGQGGAIIRTALPARPIRERTATCGTPALSVVKTVRDWG